MFAVFSYYTCKICRATVSFRLEVYIGSDINGQPDPTK